MSESWSTRAERELRRLIDADVEFSSDDLEAAVGHPDAGHSANGANNAIGTLFRAAKAAGRIEAVGVRQSTQPHRKGGMVRVWRRTARPRLFKL